jgi:hypothetical protein
MAGRKTMENSKGERSEKLVELAKVQGDFEAQVLKGMLESEGIEVAVRTGVTPIILPFTVDGLGQVRLYVKESDLAAAKAFMTAVEEAREAGEAQSDEPAAPEESSEAEGPDDPNGRSL